MSQRQYSRNIGTCYRVLNSKFAKACDSSYYNSSGNAPVGLFRRGACRLRVTQVTTFLECADVARADYLVTGNTRHFPRFWKKTKVITSREFVNLVTPHLMT